MFIVFGCLIALANICLLAYSLRCNWWGSQGR